MVGVGRRLEDGRLGEARVFLPLFASGGISQSDQVSKILASSYQISFLSLVPYFSVVTDLALAVVLAQGGWPGLLDPGNSISFCYQEEVALGVRVASSCY